MSERPLLMALETSTRACSVALAGPGGDSERYEETERDHARLLLPMVDDLLTEAGVSLAQLDAIAFGAGPGSFTGVRLAASVAKGLAFGADLPLIEVSSLAAVAEAALGADEPSSVIVAQDARMGEIYTATYRRLDGNVIPLAADRLIAPESLEVDAESLLAGDAWERVETLSVRVAGRGIVTRFPAAAAVVRLAAHRFERGETTDAFAAAPQYLRNNVAHRS